MVAQTMEGLVQFGVAGLMGTLWVWERMYSRRRERQLSEAHERLMRQDEQVRLLMRMVGRNTRAWVEFERTQKQVIQVLEGLRHEMGRIKRMA